MIGRTFCRWTVVGEGGYRTWLGKNGQKGKNYLFICRCSCGKIKYVSGQDLRSGKSKSCGCYRIKISTKHGDTIGVSTGKKPTPEYNTGHAMKTRCCGVNSHEYEYYGGRGIKMCDRWKNSYANFLSDMGRKPFSSASIDRIFNDGDYEKKNCRWASPFQQSINKRHNPQRGEKHT